MVVEQSGEAGFLFLSFPLEVTLASTERPPYVNCQFIRGATLDPPQPFYKQLLGKARS